MRTAFLLLPLLLSSGCTSSPTMMMASPDLAVDKASRCASTFGTALTAPYGRLDGTVLAVVPPGLMSCTRPNSDHLILQVQSGAAAYRMVVNVQSDRAGDTRVAFTERSAPLAGPAFSDGWHTGVMFDYVSTLGAHKADLTPRTMAELVAAITDRLNLDASVSVFASTSGGDSAHLVHRNQTNSDGAIVIDPTGSPLYLLMAFADQDF
jgi:hypothetical protein